MMKGNVESAYRFSFYFNDYILYKLLAQWAMKVDNKLVQYIYPFNFSAGTSLQSQ